MKPVSIADLEAALAQRPPRRARWSLQGRIEAAVAVPLLEASGGLEVWAIKRPDHLRHHAREIAFPGGKPDPADVDLVDTALRETQEELGLDRDRIRVLGELSPVPTATSRFTLNPIVILLASDVEPAPAAAEVAALIRTPLADFYSGRVPLRAIDLGEYLSPIFDFESGSMYGASAHVLEELLLIWGGLAGAALPAPRLTRAIPWQ